MNPVLDVQLVATLFLTGLIWFVQIVHYPLFAAVGEERFVAYADRHRVLTTWVVGPAMLAEALSAVALVRLTAGTAQAWPAWTGLGLVLVIWLTTAVCSVPAHGELARGFSAAAHRRLVRSNWIRTFAWTCRSVLVIVFNHQLSP